MQQKCTTKPAQAAGHGDTHPGGRCPWVVASPSPLKPGGLTARTCSRSYRSRCLARPCSGVCRSANSRSCVRRPGQVCAGNLNLRSRAAYVADCRSLLYTRVRRAREVGCVVSGHELANGRPARRHGLCGCHPEHRQGSQTEQSRHDADSVHHRTPWSGQLLRDQLTHPWKCQGCGLGLIEMFFEGSVWLVIQKMVPGSLVPCMHVRRAGTCDNALHVFAMYQDACVAHCHWWQARTHSVLACNSCLTALGQLQTGAPWLQLARRGLYRDAAHGTPPSAARPLAAAAAAAAAPALLPLAAVVVVVVVAVRVLAVLPAPRARPLAHRHHARALSQVQHTRRLCSPGTCMHADLPAPRQGTGAQHPGRRAGSARARPRVPGKQPPLALSKHGHDDSMRLRAAPLASCTAR